ncbi:MAG: PrpR N-terminal domain-containing protein [Deltaproteobacteria bacterium]|jgi:propionate catabolism operon transcriptional regulator|nr:PrpR N-terminal domain-containing protein [Deltaproteobacteria bacterium]
MPAKIAIISYRNLTEFLMKRAHSLAPPGVDVHIESAFLDTALQVARRLEESGEIEVFVSAGSNGSLLCKHLYTPVVLIQITGFDLLQAMRKLDTTKPIAVFSFDERIPFLTDSLPYVVGHLLQEVYHDREELLMILDRLKKQGVEQIIGGSMAMEAAEERGMRAYFVWRPPKVIHISQEDSNDENSSSRRLHGKPGRFELVRFFRTGRFDCIRAHARQYGCWTHWHGRGGHCQ